MEEYIEKSALVAEIESLRCTTFTNFDEGVNATVQILLETLDTLEVKEVNIEKEIANQYESNYEDYLTYEEFADIAKYFFELGMAVSNPVTAADRGTAEEIIFNLKQIEKDYHIDLTKEMEWLRNKIKKGE